MNQDPTTITCPNCGANRPAGIAMCSNCGHGRPGRSSTCPRCRTPVASGETVCRNCGARVTVRSSTPAIWIVLFILIGAPAGCLGGCFLLMASGGGAPDGSLFGLALLALAVFGFLLWMLVRKRGTK
ncbi:MAG: zinc ribbon domain-containing protein [Fimbriimonadales bacterium]